MKNSTRKLIRDYTITISVAISVALFIRFFVVEAYRIPSPAMRPTLEPGDTIFVSKWPFGLRLPYFKVKVNEGRLPTRGEIVVFSSEAQKVDYIKRVIGIPGDTIEIKAGQLLLNGKPLATKPPKSNTCGKEKLSDSVSYDICWEPPIIQKFGPEKVPAGSVFVIGDLRTQAPLEARKLKTWGMIPVTALKGKALWIWLSVEPRNPGVNANWFPQFRLGRMFRRIR